MADHQRDATEFEALYRTHADRIYGLCLRMSGDAGRALELAQDVFVRAWEKRRLRPAGADPGAWLWRLAVNTVLNALRGDRRRLARVEPVTDPGALERVSLRTPAAVHRMDLEQAIAGLPSGARLAFVQHAINGYSPREIAASQGLRSGSVRAQIFRARALLRRALEQ